MAASLTAIIPFLLSIAVLFLPGGRRLGPGPSGIALVTLAVAAAICVTGAPSSFHTINNALLWGGLGLAGAAVTESWRTGHRARLVPMALSFVLAVVGSVSLLRLGLPIVSLFAGTAVTAAVVALALKRQTVQATSSEAPRVPSVPLRRWVVTLLSPSFWFPPLGSFSQWRGVFHCGRLRDAPLSAAAETLVAALILPATLVFAGVFPFGLIVRDARLAPIGALLLLAVVVPLLPDGLEHWRALYAGWVVLAAFVAGWKARWPGLVGCAGLFAIAVGAEGARWEGVALAVLASLLALRPTMSPRLERLILLGAATCAIVALRSTLGVEVVYSAAMVLACILGVLRSPTASSPNLCA